MAYWYNVNTGKVETDDTKSRARSSWGRMTPRTRPSARWRSPGEDRAVGRRGPRVGGLRGRGLEPRPPVDRDGVAVVEEGVPSQVPKRSASSSPAREQARSYAANGVTGHPVGRCPASSPKPAMMTPPAATWAVTAPTAASRVPGPSNGMTLPARTTASKGPGPSSVRAARSEWTQGRCGARSRGNSEHRGVDVDPCNGIPGARAGGWRPGRCRSPRRAPTNPVRAGWRRSGPRRACPGPRRRGRRSGVGISRLSLARPVAPSVSSRRHRPISRGRRLVTEASFPHRVVVGAGVMHPQNERSQAAHRPTPRTQSTPPLTIEPRTDHRSATSPA